MTSRTIPPHDPLAEPTVRAIKAGDVEALGRLLRDNIGLATVRIGSDTTSRTLLHILTDWPGHVANGAAIAAMLIGAGAAADAEFVGTHTETPLHWAASNDDVDVLDALLDAGANIDATGAVIGGGTPLDDANAFGQWKAARRLVERGARTTLKDAAALGLMDRLERSFLDASPDAGEVDLAFWYACHGGRRRSAEYLLDKGADPNWIPDWERLTPLDAAIRSEAHDVAEWLRTRGARTAGESTLE